MSYSRFTRPLLMAALIAIFITFATPAAAQFVLPYSPFQPTELQGTYVVSLEGFVSPTGFYHGKVNALGLVTFTNYPPGQFTGSLQFTYADNIPQQSACTVPVSGSVQIDQTTGAQTLTMTLNGGNSVGTLHFWSVLFGQFGAGAYLNQSDSLGTGTMVCGKLSYVLALKGQFVAQVTPNNVQNVLKNILGTFSSSHVQF